MSIIKAFAYGLIGVLIALAAHAETTGFCAYNSGYQTGWIAGQYKQVKFNTLAIDTNLRWSTITSTWEPVFVGESPKWIDFNGLIQINSGIPTSGYVAIVAKVVKNDNMIDVGEGSWIGNSSLGSGSVQFQIKDYAQPGDWYQVILNVTPISGTFQIDNNPVHTRICGVVF